MWQSIHQPCKLLNGVIPAQVALSNIACSLSSLQRWAGVRVSACKGGGGGGGVYNSQLRE